MAVRENMPSEPVSSLDVITTIGDDDLFLVAQKHDSKKIKFSDLLSCRLATEQYVADAINNA